MIQTVTVLSYDQASRAKEKFPATCAIVSILDPASLDLIVDGGFGSGQDHSLPIFDADDARVVVARMWDCGEHDGSFCPTTEDVAPIAAFLIDLHVKPEPIDLYVHCAAGVSRSGAVGEVAAILAGIPWHVFVQRNSRVRSNSWIKSLLMKEILRIADEETRL